MRVTVNGEVQELPPEATVTTVLAVLEIAPQGVAVERNRAIVPKSLYAQTVLQDGDALEIVQFVGGG
jgi:thiamine biosynthesis protein ThiS